MKKAVTIAVTLLITVVANFGICSANSAEPPSIVVIVPDAPDDLYIFLGPELIKAGRTDKVIESYFTFYSHQLKYEDYTLTVTTQGDTFTLTLDGPLEKYNNVFTLDLQNRTIAPGERLSRNLMLITLGSF